MMSAISLFNHMSSLPNKAALLPSWNQTTTPPPPNVEAAGEPVNDPDESDSNNEMEDSSDDGVDSIVTEEGGEEVDDPDFNKMMEEGFTSIAAKSFDTTAPKENKALKIVQALTQSEGDESFMKKMKRYEEAGLRAITEDPRKRRVYNSSKEIIFDKKDVLSVMQAVDDRVVVPDDTNMLVTHLCKVFLAELVEEAFRIRDNEIGPLTPEHVYAAYHKMLERGQAPDIHKEPFFVSI